MSPPTTRLRSAVALIDLAMSGVGEIDESRFRQDRLLVDATAFRVLHIGESVSALPAAVVNRHPLLPWQRIVGMRNRLAHDYDGLDPALIWRTVREHLRELRSACESELNAIRNRGE